MLKLIISLSFEASPTARVFHVKIMPIESLQNGKNIVGARAAVHPLNSNCAVHISLSVKTSSRLFGDDTYIE